MARIKVIMNERRNAYEGALKLIAEHGETVEDRQLLRLHYQALFKAQKKLDIFQTRGRDSARERKRQLLKVKADLVAEGVLPETAAEVEAAPAISPSESSETTPEPVQAEDTAATAAPSESTTAAASTPPPAKDSPVIPTGTSPQSAADTAAAGLFGGPVQSQVQKK